MWNLDRHLTEQVNFLGLMAAGERENSNPTQAKGLHFAAGEPRLQEAAQTSLFQPLPHISEHNKPMLSSTVIGITQPLK